MLQSSVAYIGTRYIRIFGINIVLRISAPSPAANAYLHHLPTKYSNIPTHIQCIRMLGKLKGTNCNYNYKY